MAVASCSELINAVIKRMTLLAKRQDLTREQFSDYWLHKHGQIPKRMQTVASYVQNLIVERLAPSSTSNAFDFDGVVELWFEDAAAQATAFATPAAKELPLDEPNFIRGITIYAVNENQLSITPKVCKALVVIRSSEIGDEGFELSEPLHALIAGLPRENLVTLNKLGKAGWRDTLWHEPTPPDVIVELGFASAEEVAAFSASPSFKDLQSSVSSRGGAVECYRVEPRRII
jgi:uncharacterized protein (TIGR02118 family)